MKVSVVMPVFNGGRYLREAIESVLAQTHQQFTLWIGDNVSTDNSVEIAENYKDPRIRLIKHPHNFGIYGNVNRLIRSADGDLIQIACADDRLLPTCLEYQVKLMNDQPELGFVYCDTTATEYQASRPPRKYQGRLPDILYPEAGGLALFCFGCLPGDMTNVMLRKRCFEEVGGFREDLPYAGDFDLWARMSAKFPFGLNRQKLTFEREHAGRASKTMTKNCAHAWQVDGILEDLFSRIDRRYRRLARAHGTLFHAAHLMLHVLKSAARGHLRTAALAWRKRGYSYGNVLAVACLILTANQRIPVGWTCRRLLEAIAEANACPRN